MKRVFSLFPIILLVCSIQAQSISGKVTNHLGNPIPGARVAMEYSNHNTYTDEFGDFDIKIPVGIEKPALVIDHVGYSNIRVPLEKEVAESSKKGLSDLYQNLYEQIELLNKASKKAIIGKEEITLWAKSRSTRTALVKNLV